MIQGGNIPRWARKARRRSRAKAAGGARQVTPEEWESGWEKWPRKTLCFLCGGGKVEHRPWQLWRELCVKRITKMEHLVQSADESQGGTDEDAAKALAGVITASHALAAVAWIATVSRWDHEEDVHEGQWAATAKLGCTWDLDDDGRLGWSGMLGEQHCPHVKALGGWRGGEQVTLVLTSSAEEGPGGSELEAKNALIDGMEDLLGGLGERKQELQALDEEREELSDAGVGVMRLTWKTALTLAAQGHGIMMLDSGILRTEARVTLRPEEDDTGTAVTYEHKWIDQPGPEDQTNVVGLNEAGGIVDSTGGKYGMAPGAVQEVRIRKTRGTLAKASKKKKVKHERKLEMLLKRREEETEAREARVVEWLERTATEVLRTAPRVIVDAGVQDLECGRRLIAALRERAGEGQIEVVEPREGLLERICGGCGWETRREEGARCPACGVPKTDKWDRMERMGCLVPLGMEWDEEQGPQGGGKTIEEILRQEEWGVAETAGASWRLDRERLHEQRLEESGNEEQYEAGEALYRWWCRPGVRRVFPEDEAWVRKEIDEKPGEGEQIH